jgi:predicted regulator of Ras-like GTPase activity (Roadblock/LC7/MglB family)
MLSNTDKIQDILSEFVSTSTSIQAAAVMTRDGIPVASNIAENVDPARLSAISASLLSLADRTSKDLHQGELEQVLVDSTDGFVLMVKVGENAVLSVVSRSNSRLGMLLHEAKSSATKLARLV